MVLLSPFFYQKLIAFSSICSVGKRSISKTDSCVDCSILPLLSAYQEYLVALKIGDVTSGTKNMNKYTHIYAYLVS